MQMDEVGEKTTENRSKRKQVLRSKRANGAPEACGGKENEKEERNKGGDGCIKSQSCLLVPLPLALPPEDGVMGWR